MLKRLLITIAAGGLLLPISLAAASQLEVRGTNQQTGVLYLGDCDTEVTAAATGLSFGSAGPITASEVTIWDVAAACDGKYFVVQVEDGEGHVLATGHDRISHPRDVVSLDHPALLHDIQIIRVTILG